MNRDDGTFLSLTDGLFPRAYVKKIRSFLEKRYGAAEAERIWTDTKAGYLRNLADLPELGGKRSGHAQAIYGSLLIFSLYPALPDHPPIAELQDFVQNLFMEPFVRLGRVFDLNRSLDMALIDKVFHRVGKRDRKDALVWPDGFHNVSEPFGRKERASRYRFTHCPVAEFAKTHGMLHVLPLMCNSDFFGIEQIHGTLIREGTCGIGEQCDYCVVGDRNPLADAYETIVDEQGFLVSRRKDS